MLDARQSMKQAADENPTENRVFDVTLLLEKIVSDFEGFKAQVKGIIFELLTFEVSLLFATISDNKLADFVWSKVNEYGFGSIERIIDWFSVESREDKLAQVILGDTNLQVEMNLNTPDNPSYDPDIGLQYAAVAKAGILVFTDYIHDTYIAGGVSWVQSMWDWLMGQLGRSGDTLVDIVADVFTGVATALQTIKDNVGEFVDGIKEGTQFMLEAIIDAIFETLVSMVKFVIYSLMTLLLAIENSGSATLNTNSIDFIRFGQSHSLIIDYENKEIVIQFDDKKLKIVNPLKNGGELVYFETLSPDYTTGLPSMLVWMVTNMLMIKTIQSIKKVDIVTPSKFAIKLGMIMGLMIAGYIVEFIEFKSYDTEEKELFKDRLSNLHLGMGLAQLFGISDVVSNVPYGITPNKYKYMPYYGKLLYYSTNSAKTGKLSGTLLLVIAKSIEVGDNFNTLFKAGSALVDANSDDLLHVFIAWLFGLQGYDMAYQLYFVHNGGTSRVAPITNIFGLSPLILLSSITHIIMYIIYSFLL